MTLERKITVFLLILLCTAVTMAVIIIPFTSPEILDPIEAWFSGIVVGMMLLVAWILCIYCYMRKTNHD